MAPVGGDWSARAPDGAVGPRADGRPAALAPGESLLPPAGGAPSLAFEVRCADVHPAGCEQSLRADRSSDVVALACEHRTRWSTGFTPVWYGPDRLAAIAEAVTCRRG
jgi:hypothetical protein